MRGWLAGLAAILWVGGALAQGAILVVEADQRKWNGQPWDGLEVYGPVAAPTTTPPDLGMCLVTGQGSVDCLEVAQGGRRLSPCQNSYRCSFEAKGLGLREPFGVFVYDIDAQRDDLVDFVVVVPAAGVAVPPAIETALRQQLERRTPAILPMERDRRARATFVFTQEQCRAGCRLSQSILWLR